MGDIRFTFKDLHEGDEIIVTDFVSRCDYYQVASIGKCETRWHFLLEYRNGDTTKYVTFWVKDLTDTHAYLEDGRAVYVNAVDFLEDCDTRCDRIKELKDKFINDNKD